MKTAAQPFKFKTELGLTLLTGRKAVNVPELYRRLKEMPESSIYYHTHHFLQKNQFLVPEPSNDFGYWVGNVLQEERIGERLMAIDTVRFHSLGDLRRELLSVLDTFLKRDPKLREAPPGQEFHFMKCILFVLPTKYQARDLKEFSECLEKISRNSLYYHIFESPLRKSGTLNDVSEWLDGELDEKELAVKISHLDPYVHTLEELRKKILNVVEQKLTEGISHATVS